MSDVPTAERTEPVLAGLVQRINGHQDFAQWLTCVQPGQVAVLDRVWGSACALAATLLVDHFAAPLVVVCADADRIDEFPDELALFTDTACDRFPPWESDPGERVVYDEVFGQRLRVLKSLGTPSASDDTQRVIVTSIASLIQGVPGPQQLAEMSRLLQVGETLDLDSLINWLISGGLHHTSAVELPGEFSIRGGIIDIFAADWHNPVRMETFGDEIESLRHFDVTTQRSIREAQSVEITILSADNHASHHLAEYLPADTVMLLVEPGQLNEQAQHYLQRTEQPEKHFSYSQVMQQAAPFQVVAAESIATTVDATTLAFPIQSVERFTGDISRVRDELDERIGEDFVHVVCTTEAETKRVGEILAATNVAKSGRLLLELGRLSGGFRLVEEGVVVMSGSELFHRVEIHRPTRRRLGRAIDSFTDLREGDLIIHLGHGIGRYRGLQVLEREHQVEEHLKLEFAGGTKIFVPASRIGLIQKYVGGTKSRPRLAKIGGQRWLRQKKEAERAVEDMAVEMLSIQAARQARPGIRFPEDSHWQQEFDAAFPYQETADQLTAIAAIKADMCQSRPMDRLLCGDVGFGKTEMSIRAAFKAVDSGYQVAVLVPTTILAEQHLHTFRNRMAEFPIEIAALSRFSTRKQQTSTIGRLADGSVDIVIGTHRLAGRDVNFQNLGLIIIDEEQRFGVGIKERLKTIRQTVDVLTMTATPIPRTLHLSLLGARDICNLETAPEDRVAVETRVTRFNDELIRHAMLRELNRNGQIFFVHNRVQDIEKVAACLRDIVPEATIQIGHGQMPETQLEQVMVDFVAHRFDVLLATTIVESGLDIPNANTIFIDEADRYGLSDLHQLRGRVGRYKHRAYCYLLVDEKKHLSPTAAKRLHAIEEFSEMGAGFAIAMRDLEIRGAGNILGTQQSGHIAAVGYEFYCQLLESAVRKLRSKPPRALLDVDIDLPGETRLPDDYIPDMKSKIDLYRRLVRITSETEVRDIRAEMTDRFGELPPTATRLLDLCALRIDAAKWAIHNIRTEEGYVVFGYTDRQRIEQLRQQSHEPLRVVDAESAYLPLGKRVNNPDLVLLAVKSLLQADCMPL